MLQKVIKRYLPFPERIAEKKFLILGGSGFIGTHIISLLALNNVKVLNISIDEIRTDHVRLLYGIDILDHIEHFTGNMYDTSFLQKKIQDYGPDIMINLAYTNIDRRELHCLQKSLNDEIMPFPEFLSAVCEIDRLIFVGSCEEYGLNPSPFAESLKEHPISAYSLTKTLQYYILKFYLNSMDKKFLYLRPFTTYGPLQGTNMFVASAIRSILREREFYMTEGLQKREFNFVTDMAYNIILASISEHITEEILNIGSGESFAIRDIAFLIAEGLNEGARVHHTSKMKRPLDISDLVSDNSLMRNYFSPAFFVDIEEGIELTIRHYKETMENG